VFHLGEKRKVFHSYEARVHGEPQRTYRKHRYEFGIASGAGKAIRDQRFSMPLEVGWSETPLGGGLFVVTPTL
jgi:hypothetical protein